MTSQKLSEEHEILRRFMAVVVSSAFKNSLNNLLRLNITLKGCFDLVLQGIFSSTLKNNLRKLP